MKRQSSSKCQHDPIARVAHAPNELYALVRFREQQWQCTKCGEYLRAYWMLGNEKRRRKARPVLAGALV